ncbi:hypothetical protein Back11_56730 [Paenibacillus baekrokdamisoli]|uniref:Uncharacterized protein n=1 Tax=Paenibacillus baekrokdamisoli TaxID=1712516 RepID=A0A3G9JJP9_9BACL|nr:GNAT family N-acetyltransferase [Paenibacillus baekrokdamisoli]MBB3073166.1 ribosomal protein S18 acetylase RimI-like enzyme [Paenibacillus baekrokdamisoli]BBH24328.1 hypothetical protein Back11_56730 [Paenibacillus baekrokdamisoli]
MFFLKKIDEFSLQITSVLAQCMFNPDRTKMNKIVEAYEADPLRCVYAYYDADRVAAIIGLKLNPVEKSAVILHIAVDHSFRGNGIGRKLMNEIILLHAITAIEAETDKDAVNFYRSCGFTVKSLGELYPGTERFLCVMNSSH